MEQHERDVEGLDLVPSSGGVFEVTVDKKLIISEKKLGRHAEPEEVLGSIEARATDA
ncbi:MAG: hypothetical protein HY775_05535 [Acidobacteria bacterium]|nr:hypothetical protein [Acidobacteriota bacterium]